VLVRVSCIQNTQIRGETIAKVFGKVDMFWTYQYNQMKKVLTSLQTQIGKTFDTKNAISFPYEIHF
jgi:hypothetical protein